MAAHERRDDAGGRSTTVVGTPLEAALDSLLEGFAILRARRDASGRIVDFEYEYINDAGCKLNARSRAETLGHTLLELLPGHADELLDTYRRVVETGEPVELSDYDYEDTYGGRWLRRAFDVRAVRLGDGFTATWRDVTEAKRTQEAVARREAFLHAVAFGARRLLEAPDWRGAVDQFLALLGAAAGVSRVHLADVADRGRDGPRFTLRAEWVAPGVGSCLGDPGSAEHSWGDAGLERWTDTLEAGLTIHATTAELAPEERRALDGLAIRSIVVVPILVDGRLVAALGLQDCVHDRAWTGVELDAADAAAGIIGTAMARADAQGARESLVERYRHDAEELEHLFAGIRVLVAHLDTEFRFLRVNDAYATAGGHEPGYFVGRDHFELYPNEENRAIFEAVVATGEPYVVNEKAFEYADSPELGTTYWDWGLRPILDASGAVESLVLTLIDRTDAVRGRQEMARAQEVLRDREELFRTLFERAAVGIAFVDLDGCFRRVNARFAEIAGWAPDELVGRNATEITHPDDVGPHLRNVERLLAGGIESYSTEQRYVAKDGHVPWIDLHVALVRAADGSMKHLIAAINDVTTRKDAEEAVAALAADLEERVRRRTEQLEEANRNLEAFTYSVSHDLRAPLRSLSGFSEALLDEYGDTLDATGRDYAMRLQAAAERMALLIDDLLDLSRLSRAEITTTTLDLTEMARTILAELARREPDRSAVVEVEEEMRAVGDAHLLTTVLQNLLDNAWKFTSLEPVARIEVGTLPADDDRTLHCFVRDNGVGFDPAYAGKLFQPFQRLHAAHEFPGTGIGLASVRRVIERHGGRVWAESEPGQGATFHFEIPIRRGAPDDG